MDAFLTVRELNQAEREAMAVHLASADGTADITKVEGLQARIVCWGAVDEDGKQQFKPSDASRINSRWPSEALQAAAIAVLELSGLTGADDDATEPEESPN
jgi:hypothetical protein